MNNISGAWSTSVSNTFGTSLNHRVLFVVLISFGISQPNESTPFILCMVEKPGNIKWMAQFSASFYELDGRNEISACCEIADNTTKKRIIFDILRNFSWIQAQKYKICSQFVRFTTVFSRMNYNVQDLSASCIYIHVHVYFSSKQRRTDDNLTS